MDEEKDLVRFDGQVVLVSGAGRGIGRAHALLLAERGAHVVVNDVDEGVAGAVVAEIASRGGVATSAPGDVVDDCVPIIAAAHEAGGRLDALLNNAGIAWEKPFAADALAETERLLRVHALGTVALTQCAWESLVATRGRVVNTTSGAVTGLLHSTAYAAAKGAVLGFTRSLALEAAPQGVRVNAIMPMARTRMFELAGGLTGSEQDVWLSEHFPPELVAPAAVFLASHAVPCNGKVIEVSGGTAARVELSVTAFQAAHTPEEVRDALAEPPGELTRVDGLAEMLATKMSK
jgi:NAD(P)-dependent dehydrogenase (short-subunit alcohol dehydrogenase family)